MNIKSNISTIEVMPKKTTKRPLSFYLVWTCLVFVVTLAMTALYIYQNPPQPEYMWVQFGPNDSWIARLITPRKNCPSITVDEKQYPMAMRAAIDTEIPVTTCEFTLPNTARQILLRDTFLPIPKIHTKKILVIGNTVPQKQLLPKIAEITAQTNPDLIIHLGDYVSTEKKAEEYSWKTLEAEFFSPAKPLLTAAPWLFVRGMQEDCKKGGTLWFRFQDGYPYQAQCKSTTPPYLVNFANLQLLNLDSSTISSISTEGNMQSLQSQLANQPLNSHYWLITHRPLWKITSEEKPVESSQTQVNDTLQKSFTKKQLELMGLALSGHFSTVKNVEPMTPQLIAGTIITQLGTSQSASVSSLLAKGSGGILNTTTGNFGFLLLEEQLRNVWKVTEYTADGKILFSCEYKKRNVVCE